MVNLHFVSILVVETSHNSRYFIPVTEMNWKAPANSYHIAIQYSHKTSFNSFPSFYFSCYRGIHCKREDELLVNYNLRRTFYYIKILS